MLILKPKPSREFNLQSDTYLAISLVGDKTILLFLILRDCQAVKMSSRQLMFSVLGLTLFLFAVLQVEAKGGRIQHGFSLGQVIEKMREKRSAGFKPPLGAQIENAVGRDGQPLTLNHVMEKARDKRSLGHQGRIVDMVQIAARKLKSRMMAARAER